MKKLKYLSRKSYLEAWNSSKVIEFVVIYTSDGFSYMKFNKSSNPNCYLYRIIWYCIRHFGVGVIKNLTYKESR